MHMAQWFYAKGDQRLGPVDTQDLQARLEQGELNGDTLVWREGMSQWQPVREMAEELAFGSAADKEVNAAQDLAASPSVAASPYAAPQAPSYQPAYVTYGGDVVHAGFLKRFAAAVIDGTLLTVLSGVLMLLVMVLFGAGSLWTPDAASSGLIAGAPLLIVLLTWGGQAAYYTWMTSSSHQATLGKMAVGIKVVRSRGESLSSARSFGRFAAYIGLTLVTCYLALIVSAFMSGLTERKQGLHDMMVDSLVVDKWAFTANPERQRRDLGVVTWVVIGLSIAAFVAYFALLSFGVLAGLMGQS
jgi:uncharacterized RDD family membrane protein YckC